MCETYGVGVIPYSPLAGGFLTGKYKKDEPLPDSVRAKGIGENRFNDKNWAILGELEKVASDNGANVAQVSLAWLLSKPYVSAPIVGANSVEQLHGVMPAAELELSPSELDRLNEVSGWERTRTEKEV